MANIKTIRTDVITPGMEAAGVRAYENCRTPYTAAQVCAAFSAMLKEAPEWPSLRALDEAAQAAFDRGLKAGNEQKEAQQQSLHNKQDELDEVKQRRDRLADLLEIVAREALNSLPKDSTSAKTIRDIMLDQRAGVAGVQHVPQHPDPETDLAAKDWELGMAYLDRKAMPRKFNGRVLSITDRIMLLGAWPPPYNEGIDRTLVLIEERGRAMAEKIKALPSRYGCEDGLLDRDAVLEIVGGAS